MTGERPRRGAGGQPDRRVGLHELDCTLGDRFLLGALAITLHVETRFVRTHVADPGRTAVDLLDQLLSGEQVEITPHGHL